MEINIEDYQSFHQRISTLRNMDVGLDGVISTQDGLEVRVNFSFMAVCNKTLFNRITSLLRQGKRTLSANNVSMPGVKLMVDYCYSGKVEIIEDNFECIIDAALGLVFFNVAEKCTDFALESNSDERKWCLFLGAAFKHSACDQAKNFVYDMIIKHINEIPMGAIIKSLDAAFIGTILKHGTFNEKKRCYIMNIYLEMILADESKDENYRETMFHMRNILKPGDTLNIKNGTSGTDIMPLIEFALETGFAPLVEACVHALKKSDPTASITAKVLNLMRQYTGSESVRYLDLLCLHAFRHIPLDMSEDDLCFMLERNYSGRLPEFDIFKAAYKWMEHNDTNIETKWKVLNLIRFGLMTKGELDDVMGNHLLQGCAEILLAAIRYQLKPYCQPLAEGNVNKTRLNQPVVYIIGGQDAAENYTESVYMAEISSAERRVTLSSIYEVCETPFSTANSACAEVNGFIFVSGGSGVLGCVNSLFRFDSRTNIWLKLEHMLQKRRRHTLTATGEHLLAVGGWDGGKPMDSVEQYDIRNNTWTFMTELPEPRLQHAASFVNSVLYISGGSQKKALFGFCENTWAMKSPMLKPRQSHSMVGEHGTLIIVGGAVKLPEDEFTWVDELSTECYTISSDQWTELSPPKLACRRGCSVRIDNWLYIIGGFSGLEKATLDTIQRYNIENNEWDLCEIKLPHQMCNMVGACVTNK